MKVLVCMQQAQRPVPDEDTSTHINLWPNLDIIHINTDTYFKVPVMLKGEQNIFLPSADSEQAVILNTFSLSSWFFVPLLPNTPRHNLKPSKGVKPK